MWGVYGVYERCMRGVIDPMLWQAPLPEGWEEFEDDAGQPFYRNTAAGGSKW